MDDAFVKQHERRKKKRQGDQIYDVTAWSLPLRTGSRACRGGADHREDRASDARPTAAATPLPAAKVAYLMPWGTAAAKWWSRRSRAGVCVHTADEPFTHKRSENATGTAIFRPSENGQNAAANSGRSPTALT